MTGKWRYIGAVYNNEFYPAFFIIVNTFVTNCTDNLVKMINFQNMIKRFCMVYTFHEDVCKLNNS